MPSLIARPVVAGFLACDIVAAYTPATAVPAAMMSTFCAPNGSRKFGLHEHLLCLNFPGPQRNGGQGFKCKKCGLGDQGLWGYHCKTCHDGFYLHLDCNALKSSTPAGNAINSSPSSTGEQPMEGGTSIATSVPSQKLDEAKQNPTQIAPSILSSVREITSLGSSVANIGSLAYKVSHGKQQAAVSQTDQHGATVGPDETSLKNPSHTLTESALEDGIVDPPLAFPEAPKQCSPQLVDGPQSFWEAQEESNPQFVGDSYSSIINEPTLTEPEPHEDSVVDGPPASREYPIEFSPQLVDGPQSFWEAQEESNPQRVGDVAYSFWESGDESGPQWVVDDSYSSIIDHPEGLSDSIYRTPMEENEASGILESVTSFFADLLS